MINLLNTTSRVEAPFIIVEIGGETFGIYNKKAGYAGTNITYPNFMQSLTVDKVNGTVNTYTINMIYAIKQGDDPNFLEKIFSKASDRKITISYGDFSTPSFIYKKEVALITDVRSSFSIASSTITYQISATSTALSLNAGNYNFPKLKQKPSQAIIDLLYDKTYGMLEVFPGMIDKNKVLTQGLIAANDKVVDIEAQQQVSLFTRLNYLVECMTNEDSNPNSVIQKSRYALNIVDDVTGEWGGTYFKITEILGSIQGINSLDTYEIDIGYPSANIVTSFSIDDSQTYSILYNYSLDVDQSNYTYRINNEGEIESNYSPVLSSSSRLMKTTQSDKTWWTNMTQYPIQATLTLKGLLRPAMLMTYVKLNVLFYGRRHISSGYYIITKQTDSVSESGFRTTLKLLRIKGDDSNGY